MLVSNSVTPFWNVMGIITPFGIADKYTPSDVQMTNYSVMHHRWLFPLDVSELLFLSWCVFFLLLWGKTENWICCTVKRLVWVDAWNGAQTEEGELWEETENWTEERVALSCGCSHNIHILVLGKFNGWTCRCKYFNMEFCWKKLSFEDQKSYLCV